MLFLTIKKMQKTTFHLQEVTSLRLIDEDVDCDIVDVNQCQYFIEYWHPDSHKFVREWVDKLDVTIS
jgi:hypothetical protein